MNSTRRGTSILVRQERHSASATSTPGSRLTAGCTSGRSTRTRGPRRYPGRMGVLTVDVTGFGVVMSADSNPVEALDGETRALAHPGRWHTRNPIVRRDTGGFTGFTGFVGTETIEGKAMRDWLEGFGRRHPNESLADYIAALGQELTDEWRRLGLASVLEILVSGVEHGEVRFAFVRNSDGLYPDG